MELIKKYLDIIIGTLSAVFLSCIVDFNSDVISSITSVIILILVCIGLSKVVLDRRKIHRHQGVVDKIVDSQRPIKAKTLAEHPTELGEQLGKTILQKTKGVKYMWSKVLKFFDKFKGTILSLLLAILAILCDNLNIIYDLFKNVLVINGVNVVSIALTILAVVVGIISNTYTSEDKELVHRIFKDKGSVKNDVKLFLGSTLKDCKEKTDDLDISKEVRSSIKEGTKEVKKILADIENKKAKLNELDSQIARVGKLVEAKISSNEDLDKLINTQIQVEAEVAEDTAKLNDKNNQIEEWKKLLVK